jgi:hypothetical protein
MGENSKSIYVIQQAENLIAKTTATPDVVHDDDNQLCHPTTGPAAKSEMMTRKTPTRRMDKSFLLPFQAEYDHDAMGTVLTGLLNMYIVRLYFTVFFIITTTYCAHSFIYYILEDDYDNALSYCCPSV